MLKKAVYSGNNIFRALYKPVQSDPSAPDLDIFKIEDSDKRGSRVIYLPVVARNTVDFRTYAATMYDAIDDTASTLNLTVTRGIYKKHHL